MQTRQEIKVLCAYADDAAEHYDAAGDAASRVCKLMHAELVLQLDLLVCFNLSSSSRVMSIALQCWRVLTVNNCFSLGQAIKNKWINLCVKLLNNAPLSKHIRVTYQSDDVRAQMTLLYWREHWRDQLSADEPGAISHLHSVLQSCKMDDVDGDLTKLEQKPAHRT